MTRQSPVHDDIERIVDGWRLGMTYLLVLRRYYDAWREWAVRR